MADGVTADLMSRAQFVIQATVRSPGQSTVPDIPVDDHTVVFRIDQVLHAPAALARSAGRDVTVQLAEGSQVPAVGEQVTLFTTTVAFGDGFAVAEVGRTGPSAGRPVMTSTIAAEPGARPHPVLEEALQLGEQRLKDHAAQADAIALGRVVHLEKAGDAPFREHDPDWWLATVAVEHGVRGPAADTIRFVFPNSRDIRWAGVPKPAAGQAALWLLHSATGAPAEMADYVLLDADDVQRPDELDRLGLAGGGQ